MWQGRGLWLPAIALLIASLACAPLSGVLGGGENAEVVDKPAEETEIPEEVPPTNTPRPEPTATPVPEGIGVDTVDMIRKLRDIEVSNNVMLAAAFSPAGGHDFFSLGGDTVLQQWDADTGDKLLEVPAHNSFGWALAFSPDGSMLASAAEDFRMHIWDPESGSRLNTIQINSAGYRIAWAPDGSAVAVVGDFISRAEVFDPETGQIVAEPKTGSRPLFGIAWSHDGTMLAVSDIGRNVFVYGPLDNYSLVGQAQTEGTGWDLEFSPDDSLLATCNAGGNVEVWQTSNFSRLWSQQAYPYQCGDAVFTASGDMLITSGDDRIIFWDPESGRVLREIPTERFGWWLTISADGNRMVMAQDNGTLVIYGLP